MPDLQKGWPIVSDYLIAHLRAQKLICAPWIIDNLPPKRKILDIGCGDGVLANALANAGHQVTGVDLCQECLNRAAEVDATHSVRYLNSNAYSLPFQDGEFDAVLTINILEHVEEPRLLIGEAARVIKAKGSIFFQTANRTWLNFVFNKGFDWCMHSALSDMHFFLLSITPDELEDIFEMYKLNIQSIRGFRPRFSLSFWKMMMQRRIRKDFSYRFCDSLKMGYCGIARKRGSFSLK